MSSISESASCKNGINGAKKGLTSEDNTYMSKDRVQEIVDSLTQLLAKTVYQPTTYIWPTKRICIYFICFHVASDEVKKNKIRVTFLDTSCSSSPLQKKKKKSNLENDMAEIKKMITILEERTVPMAKAQTTEDHKKKRKIEKGQMSRSDNEKRETEDENKSDNKEDKTAKTAPKQKEKTVESKKQDDSSQASKMAKKSEKANLKDKDKDKDKTEANPTSSEANKKKALKKSKSTTKNESHTTPIAPPLDLKFLEEMESKSDNDSGSDCDKMNKMDNPCYDTVKDLSAISKESMMEYINGLCFGASIGDSLGLYYFKSENKKSVSEKIKKLGEHEASTATTTTTTTTTTTDKEVDLNDMDIDMELNEVTDDTEMAMCIARGLLKMIDSNARQNKGMNEVTMKYIVEEYQMWLLNPPGDHGRLIDGSIGGKDVKTVENVRHKAYEMNSQIKSGKQKYGVLSNGSLIRCVPLIVYGIRLPPRQTFQLMLLESSLTHASYIVYFTLTAYALTAQYLIRNYCKSKKHELAVCYALQFLEEQQNIFKASPHNDHNANDNTNADAIAMVIQWIKEARQTVINNTVNDFVASLNQEANSMNSHIRIGFQIAFYHLCKASTFVEAMEHTLTIQGNSDSNCCVVGGLMGAFHGITQLRTLKQLLVRPNSKSDKHRQPYHAKHYEQYLRFLFRYALHPQRCFVGDATKSCNGSFDEFVLQPDK
ncbi:hypothetical protein RFI_18455 [Reticulomyxa filosa]|uniref:ADP-ribosylhydrolase ARH3 n=1 Tax=Reticulomyxa filosa TaxID=46433 RepID=X6MY84_RETFI|nr:hypothetical protein RFI_18455 [Reticulomyxa filosa]|eukprot:ETO18791.1 hypothetical protein RFI_18455 [Reticulomyxa filosa]